MKTKIAVDRNGVTGRELKITCSLLPENDEELKLVEALRRSSNSDWQEFEFLLDNERRGISLGWSQTLGFRHIIINEKERAEAREQNEREYIKRLEDENFFLRTRDFI